MASIASEPRNPAHQTPPKKPRHKATRVKEESKLLQENVGDIIVTPKPKKRDQPRSHSKDVSNLYNDSTSPSTPPILPVPIGDLKMEQGSSPSTSARKNRRGRKKTSTKQGESGAPVGNAIMQGSIEQSTHSPPFDSSQVAATPMKQATQMYAGPTFHASPAPSSLPIPKFFAKPISQTDVSENLKSVSSDELSSHDSSSQPGGDSPTLRNSLRVAEKQAREPSPLDIFFKADREEKARKAQSIPNSATIASMRAKSASPSTETFRQHARRPTDSTWAPPSPNSAENIRAKTEALKNLLLFPHAQRPSASIDANKSTPSLNSPHTAIIDKTPSDTLTPTRRDFYANHPYGTRSQSSIQDPTGLPVPTMGHLPSQQRRPLPYHLRQEFLNSLPLGSADESQSKPRFVSSVAP